MFSSSRFATVFVPVLTMGFYKSKVTSSDKGNLMHACVVCIEKRCVDSQKTRPYFGSSGRSVSIALDALNNYLKLMISILFRNWQPSWDPRI